MVTTRGSVTGSTIERQVDLAGGHLGHELVRAGLDHRQVDARVAGVELDQGRGQHAGDEARRGPDGEMRPRAMPESARASAPVASTSASTRCMKGSEGTAVGGEGDPPLARAPVEEHHAELVLEQADLAGQRGLGQMQPGGGPGEALLLGHGQGVGQLVQLHHIQSL